MNIWKPIAIGAIGYIYGVNKTQKQYSYPVRRTPYNNGINVKDILTAALSNTVYRAIFGETPLEARIRKRSEQDSSYYKRDYDNPRKPDYYTPVYRTTKEQADEMIENAKEEEEESTDEEYNYEAVLE